MPPSLQCRPPMSYLNKLGISGIRSFDPDHITAIQFFRPLTVIVGANGCGKTTIIECLKYATTSALPCAGATFVHDPQISKEAEIKASVRLKFTTGGGKQYTSQQTMRVKRTVRGGRPANNSFKTLETVLTFHDRDRKQDHHLGGKCATLAEAVPRLLGVSKPILENVFFCHQEDSNWPMGSPRELQDKFNAIFMVSKYTKAMANIKDEIKFRKSAKDKVALQEATLAGEVNQIKEWRKQQEQHQNEVEVIEKHQEDLRVQLEEKTEMLQEAEGMMRKFSQHTQRLKELRSRLEMEARNLKEAVADRKSTIHPRGFPDKTQAEVEALRVENQNQIAGDGDIGPLHAELEEAQHEKEKCESEIQRCAAAYGQKEEQVKQHDRIRKDLQECMEGIGREYDILDVVSDVFEFESAMERIFDAKRQKSASEKAQLDKQQAKIEQELVVARSAIATAKNLCETLRKKRTQLMEEIASTSTAASSSSGSGGGSSSASIEVRCNLWLVRRF